MTESEAADLLRQLATVTAHLIAAQVRIAELERLLAEKNQAPAGWRVNVKVHA